MFGLILSIVKRELIGAPRRKRFYLWRCALVLAGGIVLLIGFGNTVGSPSQAVGLTLFLSLSITSLLGMGIAALTGSLALIRREKDARTIGLVLLSDVSVGSFLAGKLLVALLSGAIALASVLPLFMLSISLGGVSAPQILLAGGILLSTLFLGNGIGLFAASATRSEKAAASLLFVIGVLYFLVLPVWLTIWGFVKFERFLEFPISILSPMVAMVQAIHGRAFGLGGLHIAANLALGLVFLGFAPRLLRWSVLHEESAGPLRRLQGSWRARLRKRGWGIPRSTDGNAVAWKDLHFLHGGMQRSIILSAGVFVLIAVTIAVVMIFVNYRDSTFSLEDYIHALIIGCSVVFAAVCFFNAISGFGESFHAERKSRALEMLLITPLSDWDIMRGKILAVWQMSIPWLVALGVSLLGLVILFGDDSDFWEGAFFFPYYAVPMVLGYCGWAMWLSVHSKRNVAVGAVLLGLFGYNSLGRWLLTVVVYEPLFRHGRDNGWAMMFLILTIDLVFHLIVGWLFFRLTYISFRQKALQDV